MTRSSDKDRSSGFTIVELLIVMTVIGILAAIAVPRFNVTRHKAYRATMTSDLKSLANSQEVYYNVHFTYSSILSDLEAAQSQAVTLTINEATSNGWAATSGHLGLPADQCGVYYGDAAAAGASPATVAGVIACTF